MKSQLPVLRVRAREVEQNSNLARSFLSLCETHIVGPVGFTLQVQGRNNRGELDTNGNKKVESEFKRWCKRGVCEISGVFLFLCAACSGAHYRARW
ncbi:phage portal protein [Thiohalophilus sp.]|uniref:phage portal protein n=1 Tax=Thiohalophilus sp. TaxID=3028392 RepID=UPI003A0FF2F2